MSKTIKVRIAVAVDKSGTWSASGWGNQHTGFNAHAMDTAVDGVGDGKARYWVDAVLHLPEVPVVDADSVDPAQ